MVNLSNAFATAADLTAVVVAPGKDRNQAQIRNTWATDDSWKHASRVEIASASGLGPDAKSSTPSTAAKTRGLRSFRSAG